MKKLLIGAAVLAAATTPQMASAQALPATVVAVVDIQRATSQCNACKTAFTTLESQFNGLKALQTQLDTPLQAEAKAIQAAINALGGKPADAALSARVKAFETKQADAQRQLSARQQTFERNRAYVFQQISTKLDPALTSVLARRNATVMLDTSNVVRFTPAIDVTNDVIAALNATLTSVATTAPATAAQPAGR